jgi:hypothetical protein
MSCWRFRKQSSDETIFGYSFRCSRDSLCRPMNLAISTFANVALGVLTSSFVSSAVFYWLTGRKERTQFLRTKLEELFTAYQGYGNLVASTVFYPWHMAMTKVLT